MPEIDRFIETVAARRGPQAHVIPGAETLMKCRRCGSAQMMVVDSLANDAGTAIRRRRKCDDCGERITSYETSLNPYVIAADDAKELVSQLISDLRSKLLGLVDAAKGSV